MSSGSSHGNVSPGGSSSGGSYHNLNPKQDIAPSHLPPAFWQEKVARSYEIVDLLEQNPDLRLALHESPTLARQFIKHPVVGAEVAKDKKLASSIIRKPHLFKELVHFHHFVHVQKRDEKIREFVKLLEKEYIRQHYHDQGRVVLPFFAKNRNKVESSNSDLLLVRGRATIPDIPNITVPEGAPEPPATLKYLLKEHRLYLRHDVMVQRRCAGLYDKKTSYYNIMNSYNRLLYRCFYRHRQLNREHFRPFEMAIKDPDDRTLFVVTQMWKCGFRRGFAVQTHYTDETKQTIGFIHQRKRCCHYRSQFFLRNAEEESMIHIVCRKRPFLSRFRYHPKFVFELKSFGAHKDIGKISAEWIDTPPGVFESEKNYGVSFPKDLAINVKIIVMAAWLIIYRRYYNGKCGKHHLLSESEKTLLQLAEESECESELRRNFGHSSDSVEEKDKRLKENCKKLFNVQVIAAEKGVGLNIDESHKKEINKNYKN